VTFEELTERVHTLMERYKIDQKHDLAFVAELAWVFGLELDFKVSPKQQEPKP
jgi:hypothetical protein